MDRAWRIRPYLLLLSIAAGGAACSGPDLPNIGADADVDVAIDGDGLGAGVGLRFLLQPGVDERLDLAGDSFAVAKARLDIANLRLIGDAATGDGRTSLDVVMLDWGAEVPQNAASFPDAPPGLYSLVRGSVKKLDLEIEVEPASGDSYKIEIDYNDSLIAIDFPLEYTLEAGASLELEVAIDLEKVIAAIDLGQLDIDDEGKAEIDEESANMDSVLDALSSSFQVQGLL